MEPRAGCQEGENRQEIKMLKKNICNIPGAAPHTHPRCGVRTRPPSRVVSFRHINLDSFLLPTAYLHFDPGFWNRLGMKKQLEKS